MLPPPGADVGTGDGTAGLPTRDGVPIAAADVAGGAAGLPIPGRGRGEGLDVGKVVGWAAMAVGVAGSIVASADGG